MNDYKEEHEWNGEERRSIPIHVLNYMDHRLGEHTNRIEDLFKEHITDEMERYGDIVNKLESSAIASQKRHSILIDQLTIVTGNTELIKGAFPKSKEGLPDYNEHHDYHFTWKTRKEWWAGTSSQAVRKLFEWMLMAFVIWMGTVIWQAALQGPK
jgi:hypothetical protein